MRALRAEFSTCWIDVPNCSICNVAVHPAYEQHEEISVIMRITRVPNSAATTRCDIIVISASPLGTHHHNFLGWFLFKSYRCLVWWTGGSCCPCSSWWHLDCGVVCCCEIVADGAYASTSHGLMVICRHIVVLVKHQHLVAKNERAHTFIDWCNNYRWPNDTC